MWDQLSKVMGHGAKPSECMGVQIFFGPILVACCLSHVFPQGLKQVTGQWEKHLVVTR